MTQAGSKPSGDCVNHTTLMKAESQQSPRGPMAAGCMSSIRVEASIPNVDGCFIEVVACWLPPPALLHHHLTESIGCKFRMV